MNRDWNGSIHSLFVCNGASNHTQEERQKDDYYATDPVAIEPLFEVGGVKPDSKIWECACGEGHLSKALKEHGVDVYSSDLIDRGYGESGVDFLKVNSMPEGYKDILTNPPYKYAKEFVEHSLDLLQDGSRCIMFLKLTFLEGKARKALFINNPPKKVYVFSGRVSCKKNGDFEKSGSSAVAYAWYVWEKGYKGETVVEWIA